MRHTIGGEAASSPDSLGAKDRALKKYLDEFILPTCRDTSDDGFLFLVLVGQAEGWDEQAGRLDYAADYAFICRTAVRVLEARMRSKLGALEITLARLDAPHAEPVL